MNIFQNVPEGAGGDMKNSLIIALDFATKKEVIEFLKPFGSESLFLKVGMELFYQEGPAIIEELKASNHQIFLDLKLHDIPNTVNKAMRGLARLGCDLVNVHAAGGKEMMVAALEGLYAGTPAGNKRPKCIAVTQLTSTSQQQMQTEQLVPVSIEKSVLHYASIAQQSGLDGVVCSTWESKKIQHSLGNAFLTVTPGIRIRTDDAQDQKRVATPEIARAEGVSAIVVGRPITKANDPFQNYHTFKKAWEGVLQ